MNWVKGFALVTCLATPLAVIVAEKASADPAADSKPTMSKDTTTKDTATKDTMTKKPAMSDADKRAKAADCSTQANAKNLHGEARKKFRSECKRK